MATQRAGVKVEGIEDVLKALREMGPEARKLLNKELKSAGELIRSDARSRFPSGPPLSRWVGGGRTSGGFPRWSTSTKERASIKVATGKGSRKAGTYRAGALVRITEDSAAAAVFDFAGSQGGDPARTFVQNMVAKHGPERRTLLGAYDETGPKAAEQAGERARDLLVKLTQDRLDRIT